MTPDVWLRIGGLVYGGALIVLGAAVLSMVVRAGPHAAATLRELSAALREHSAALRSGGATAPERLDRIEAQVSEIHARVCDGPPGR